jgi:hypothetical protein
MKNKFLIIAITIYLASFAAAAQDKSGSNFYSHKIKTISYLNQEKAIIDKQISCINSANKKEDINNCYKEKEAVIKKFREEKRAQREQKQNNKESIKAKHRCRDFFEEGGRLKIEQNQQNKESNRETTRC